MRTALLIVCSFMLLVACKKKDRIPGNVLSKEKMQAVLQDMMRADQFLTDFVFSRDTSLDKRTESIKLYNQVFAIHQISKEEFRKSFSFYRSHPGLMKAVMDSIGANKPETKTTVPGGTTPPGDTAVQSGKKIITPDTTTPKKDKRPLRIE
ncbi:MAG: DUF4296 domain-containing protein [Bacteroidota bacterium]